MPYTMPRNNGESLRASPREPAGASGASGQDVLAGSVGPPGAEVRLPLRGFAPAQIEVFLGPTNSGKTHQALQHLARRGTGVYAAPLRMLAYEAYERLGEQIGLDRVGLVTGEERVNAGAPVICCTAEMAPMNAELLVLDEVQWAQDPERGWAWTRLLAGAEVAELYVTGEVGAAPLVQAILGESTPVTLLDRLCPLVVDKKPVSLGEIPKRSVLVAFSRKAVLHLAGLLREEGRSVAVLYGALPPDVRRAEIHRFITGDADVVVATDVIGHGINLPVDCVVFAETNKFDGKQRRSLAAWEAAQIGGRAGRFGFSEVGIVSCLRPLEGFEPDPDVIAMIDQPKVSVSGRRAYRRVTYGFVAPALDDLGVKRSTELPAALREWRNRAVGELAGLSWARVAPVEPLIKRLALLRRTAHGSSKTLLSRLHLEDAWALARSPCDPDEDADAMILGLLGRQITGDASAVLRHIVEESCSGLAAPALEARARELVILRWAALRFRGRIDISHEAVSESLDELTDELNAALSRAVEHGIARCVSCHKICAPWFPMCDRCHAKARSWRMQRWDLDELDYLGYTDYSDGIEDEYELPPPRSKKPAGKHRRKGLEATRDAIARAVAMSPACERIANVSRSRWADTFIPAILALERESERGELRSALVTLFASQTKLTQNACVARKQAAELLDVARQLVSKRASLH